jgi:hypothetical protein
MLEFLYSILASIIGGAILLIVVSFVSDKARWVLTGFLALLVGADLEFVYQNKKACEKDLNHDLKETRDLIMIIPRGNELQREAFLPIFLEKPNSAKRRIRILMPRTRDIGSENDWVDQRESELKQFDKAFGTGLLKRQIETNINFLVPFVDSNDVDLRFYNAPHIGRIIVTDSYAYFGALTSEIHARDNKVYKYRKGGPMYLNYLRLCNQLWDIGRSDEIDNYRK